MRCNIEIINGRIIKSVCSNESVYNTVRESFSAYSDWLKGVGIVVPDTRVYHQDGILYFNQEYISEGENLNLDRLISRIKLLEFDKYGIDCNPSNFIYKNNTLFYIDIFPFLINDSKILEYQFPYSYETICQRYFTGINAVATLLNRVAKQSSADFIQGLYSQKEYILDNFTDILPREKTRLLYALQNNEHSDFTDIYIDYYVKTKELTTISADQDFELCNILKSL